MGCQHAGAGEKVVHEPHGGGWVLGSAMPKWESSYMCDEMLRHADGYSRVFQIECRLDSRTRPAMGVAVVRSAVAGHGGCPVEVP